MGQKRGHMPISDPWANVKQAAEPIMRDVVEKWQKLRDIGGTNLELGRYHLAQGNLDDALFRFRLAAWFKPGSADAWAGLAETWLARGNKPKARTSAQQALKIAPNHPGAAAVMAALATPPAA